MTIKLLAQYGRAPAGVIVTLDSATETALVAAKQASTDLTGGAPWTDPYTLPASSANLLPSEVSAVRSVLSGPASPIGWVRTPGTVICDWRGTLSGTGYALDNTSSCPAGTAVVSIAGDGMTDSSAPGNSQCTMSFAAVSTVGVNTLGIWACVPKRSAARKNYRNVPLKALFAVDNTFAKFFTAAFNARADGKWHFYIIDLASVSLSSFVLGTDSIGCVRVRASIDNGVTANALTGTAPLQTGETAFFGGIVVSPRAQAMAIVRFDDMMVNLYTKKAWVVGTQYSGVSGVVVPAGSYSAFDLMNFYGLAGTCFILTKYLNNGGSQYFESIQGLQALQSAGWEICWQTHANPVSVTNYGVRLLGPLGVNWFAQASNNHAVDGTVTTVADNDIAGGTGQGTAVTLTGTPPAPLVAGQTYWIRGFTTKTAKFYNSEADSVANVNPITFASAGSATWGWSFAGATTDATAINNEFATGVAAMKAAGLNGWMHWAPNQGAFDATMEDAFYANGFASAWPIGYGSFGSIAGMVSQFSTALGLVNYVPHLPTFMVTLSAFATDAAGATEGQARAYVQSICKYGGIGQNYHHNEANVTVLLAYLDELKYRQDRGEIVVATPSRIAALRAQYRIDF